MDFDVLRAQLPLISAGAAARDRTREHPRDVVDWLSGIDAFAITVPASVGGIDGGAVQAAELTRLLATADPSVAQIPQSHFAYLHLVRLAGSDALRKQIYADVLAGLRIANAQSERGGASSRDVRTTIEVDSARAVAVLNGTKYFCTGSVHAHWLAVLARDTDGAEQVAFVRADSPGVTVLDDWNAFGQRTTGSGTVHLDDVTVPLEHVVPRADAISGPHAYGPLAQVLHAAIDAGIARGALVAAAERVHLASRPWFEAHVEHAHQDPLLIQRFGELEALVIGAEATLARAAQAVDFAAAQQTPDAHRDASLAVASAKVLSDRAALEASSALFELAGASSTDTRLGLDRFWRDARTHTTHDPVRWKIHHLGQWALNRTPPPRHGLI